MSQKSPFFRYSRILGGYGWIKNRKVQRYVHGLFFTFSEPDQHRKNIVRDMVEETFREQMQGLFNVTVTQDGEEVEEVMSDEAQGVGFYRAQILVNELPIEKIDLRYRR